MWWSGGIVVGRVAGRAAGAERRQQDRERRPEVGKGSAVVVDLVVASEDHRKRLLLRLELVQGQAQVRRPRSKRSCQGPHLQLYQRCSRSECPCRSFIGVYKIGIAYMKLILLAQIREAKAEMQEQNKKAAREMASTYPNSQTSPCTCKWRA